MIEVENFRLRHDLTGREYTLALPRGEHIAGQVAGGTPYERDLVRVIASFLRDGDVMADIGAHAGNHTAYVALANNELRVEACEANPETFDLLTRNVQENGLRRQVTCHQVAVGATVGSASLVSLASDDTGSTAVKLDEDGVVPVAPLRDLYEGPIRFAKIDVEGFELEVLSGMRDMLERERPVLALELHNDAATRSETPICCDPWAITDCP